MLTSHTRRPCYSVWPWNGEKSEKALINGKKNLPICLLQRKSDRHSVLACHMSMETYQVTTVESFHIFIATFSMHFTNARDRQFSIHCSLSQYIFLTVVDCSIVLKLLWFLILPQVHIVQTPQGEDYEGKTFHGKRVSELHLLPAIFSVRYF